MVRARGPTLLAWVAVAGRGAEVAAAASERTLSARATTAESVFHVAVTDTPEDGIVSCADDPWRGSALGLATRGSAGPAVVVAPAPWAVSGATRIASVRPIACAGQRWRELGWPR